MSGPRPDEYKARHRAAWPRWPPLREHRPARTTRFLATTASHRLRRGRRPAGGADRHGGDRGEHPLAGGRRPLLRRSRGPAGRGPLLLEEVFYCRSQLRTPPSGLPAVRPSAHFPRRSCSTTVSRCRGACRATASAAATAPAPCEPGRRRRVGVLVGVVSTSTGDRGSAAPAARSCVMSGSGGTRSARRAKPRRSTRMQCCGETQFPQRLAPAGVVVAEQLVDPVPPVGVGILVDLDDPLAQLSAVLDWYSGRAGRPRSRSRNSRARARRRRRPSWRSSRWRRRGSSTRRAGSGGFRRAAGRRACAGAAAGGAGRPAGAAHRGGQDERQHQVAVQTASACGPRRDQHGGRSARRWRKSHHWEMVTVGRRTLAGVPPRHSAPGPRAGEADQRGGQHREEGAHLDRGADHIAHLRRRGVAGTAPLAGAAPEWRGRGRRRGRPGRSG